MLNRHDTLNSKSRHEPGSTLELGQCHSRLCAASIQSEPGVDRLVGQAHRPWLGTFWQPSFRLTFNLGAGRLQTSTLRRRVNQTDWAGAALELRKWVHGGGRVFSFIPPPYAATATSVA